MAQAPSPEEQIMALRRELAQRDAIIAMREAELAEAAVVKARLTAALLEIEQIKMQLATLRRQRYGQSSERLESDIAQLEMRLEDCQEDVGEQFAARPERDRQRVARPREKSGRKALPPHLPREVVVHEPEIVCSCDNCDPARLARRGAHIFRHSLATELLRSGATLTEIGQLLRHESHDTTRIYAKVDIEALRTLSLPWPGGAR